MAFTSTRELPRRRFYFFDFARGVLILLTVLAGFYVAIAGLQSDGSGVAADSPVGYLISLIAFGFLMVSGICLYLTHRNQFRPSHFFVRMFLIGCSAFFVAFAHANGYAQYFYFKEILFFILIGNMLAALFIKAPYYITLIASIVLFYVLLIFPATFPALAGVIPLEQLHLLKWTSVVVAGLGIGQMAEAHGYFQYVGLPQPKHVGLRIIAELGSTSLVIFLAYPVVLLIIFEYLVK